MSPFTPPSASSCASRSIASRIGAIDPPYSGEPGSAGRCSIPITTLFTFDQPGRSGFMADDVTIAGMSWEAFRLTSKSPTEVYHVLGPHGVDDLIRKMMDVVWREYPEESRTFDNVRKRVQEVYQRNMRHWSTIKKPAPAAFFENLLPYAA